MGDENCARETHSLPRPPAPVPEPVADERLCAQRFGGNGQKGSNHRGILPRGQLGCTGDLVTNCPLFFLHLD